MCEHPRVECRYADWVLVLLEWPNLISADLFTPPECIAGGYLAQLLLSSSWPWGVILMVIAYQIVSGSRGASSSWSSHNIRSYLVPWDLILVVIAYQIISGPEGPPPHMIMLLQVTASSFL